LIDNADHPVLKLNFKGCDLGISGIRRLLEATNVNKNIKKINLGKCCNGSL